MAEKSHHSCCLIHIPFLQLGRIDMRMVMKGFTCLATILLLAGSQAYGQSIFATLTGVVSDPSGAVVPNAKVQLRNESTGSLRDTVTNTDGYFTFASLAVGDFTYELIIDAQGFAGYKASGIALGGGEKRNI